MRFAVWSLPQQPVSARNVAADHTAFQCPPVTLNNASEARSVILVILLPCMNQLVSFCMRLTVLSLHSGLCICRYLCSVGPDHIPSSQYLPTSLAPPLSPQSDLVDPLLMLNVLRSSLASYLQ